MTNPNVSVPTFGRHLPPEILNEIFKLLLEDDRAAAILPRPMVLTTGAQHNQDENEDDWNVTKRNDIITSMHPLHYLNKESRAIYNSMFKAKALNMDLDHIVATVQDFNFDYFFRDLLVQIPDPARSLGQIPNAAEWDPYGKFLKWPFKLHLVFTEEFLQDFTDEGINRWLDNMTDHAFVDIKRNYRFSYQIEPIPRKYIDGLHEFLSELVFARRGKPGAELLRIMENVRVGFMTGQIYKAE